MGKSYSKYKTMGVCYGSNIEYYRDRVHYIRNKNKHRMRNILANQNIEDFDDMFIDFRLPKKDDWDEPTDGTYKLSAKLLKRLKSNYNFNGIYSTKNGKIKK